MPPRRPRRHVLAALVAATGLVAAAALVDLAVRGDGAAPGASERPPADAQPRGLAGRPGSPGPAPGHGTVRLVGRVVTPGGGPVASATVTLERQPEAVTTARSRSDGAFTFDGLRPGRYVVAAHAGDVAARSRRILVTATTGLVTLIARPGSTLVLHVVDERGTAVVGARVELDARRTVATDATGTAVLDGVADGLHVAVARAPGRIPTRVSLPRATGVRVERTVVVRPGALLSGTAVDAGGRPVAGAQVSTVGPGGDHTTTDARGGWSLRIGPGSSIVSASLPGQAASDRVLVTSDGETARTGLVLRLAPRARVRGRVIDRTGAPVADATVSIRTWMDHAEVRTNGSGRFDFAGLPRAHVDAYACAGDRCSRAADVDLTEHDRDNLVLTLRDGTIAGVLVDGANRPVPDVDVMATPELEGGAVEALPTATVTDDAGRFVLGPLPGDEYVLMVGPPRMMSLELQHGGAHAHPGDRDVRITRPASGAITGRVTIAGKPVDRASVALGPRLAVDMGLVEKTLTPARFTLPDVPTGTWRLGVTADAAGRRDLDRVEVTAGKTTDVGTIDLPRSELVHSRVVDDGGRPVAGAEVIVGNDELPALAAGLPDMAAPDRGPIITAADGTFALAFAPGAGTLRLGAVHPRLGRAPLAEVPAHGEVVLRLAPTGSIAGAVVGVDPMTATVSATTSTTGYGGGGLVAGTGRFRIDGLAPGRYRVRATTGAAESAPADVEVTPGAVAEVRLVFGEHRLVVETGAVSGACFAALMPPGDAAPSLHASLQWSICDGQPVTFDQLAPGAYRVCVNHRCQGVTVPEAAGTQTVRLRP